MIDLLPNYYDESPEVDAIMDAGAQEFESIKQNAKDLLDQLFIETATWGLSSWERIAGIPVSESKPIDQRRSLLKSKLRGNGTVTVELIKNVAESFQYGEVSVIENNSNYAITIKFVGKYGIPPNLNDIKSALLELIPAHLAVNFEFTYVIYREVKANYSTYGDLKAANLSYAELLVTN